MKALKIDVTQMTVTEVEIVKGDLNSIYKQLGENVSLFDCPVYLQNGDCIYCDDEGWFKPTLGGFAFVDWKYPIVNNALVIGTGSKGESEDVKSKAEEIESQIIWITADAMSRFKPSYI